MEVRVLHIKITMIRCLLNLLDDFSVLRRSGWNISADIPILRRSNWLLASTIFSKLFRFAPFLAVHVSLVSRSCIKHSVAKDRIVWNRYRKRKWQNLLRNFRQETKLKSCCRNWQRKKHRNNYIRLYRFNAWSFIGHSPSSPRDSLRFPQIRSYLLWESSNVRTFAWVRVLDQF